MPLYEYECPNWHVTEEVKTVAERNNNPACRECGEQTKRIIASNIRREEPTWLTSALQNLADDAKHVCTDRSSFNRYLKEQGLNQIG